jgi:hypothetical protein
MPSSLFSDSLGEGEPRIAATKPGRWSGAVNFPGHDLVIEARPLGFKMDIATISSKTHPFQNASTL